MSDELVITGATVDQDTGVATVTIGPASEVPAEEPVEQPKLEDFAARAYQNLVPKFRSQLSKISGVQSKKILIALMEFPFEKTDFKWPYPEAEEMFKTGLDIMDCRFVLTRAAIELSLEQKKAILKEAKEKEQTEKTHV